MTQEETETPREIYIDPSEGAYKARDLEKLPVLCQGQADDLHLQNTRYRIWLSRCGVEDGEPCNNKITVEEYDGRRWSERCWYPG